MENTSQINELDQNFEICKILSKQVYGEILISPITISSKAEQWKFLRVLVDEECKPYHKGSFACSAYKKDKTIIISFRGTDDIPDIFVDTRFLFRETPAKTVGYAREYYNAVKAENMDCEFIFTGHSLGGAYAQFLSYQLAKEKDNNFFGAITFNAPGVDYILEDSEETMRAFLTNKVSNYVIMNDYVGNFQKHIGKTYYFQPYDLFKYRLNEDNGKWERETAHCCILSYNEKEFGPCFSFSEEFAQEYAWALWVFDAKNANSGESKTIRPLLDNLMRVKAQDLTSAVAIMRDLTENIDVPGNIKLLNHFHYDAKVDDSGEDLLTYEEVCERDKKPELVIITDKEKVNV